MAKIYVLQHHPVESLCNIADALEGAALAWQYVHVNEGQSVPASMKGAGGLVVLGGPMGVYQTERYPWLRDEMRLIEDAIGSNLPVLGICLGAQILAAALGAKVDRNPNGKEIGWHPIRLSDAAKDDRLMRDLPATMTPFHWHGDIFDLPSGAVSLASSDKTPCQAFRHGDKTYGFQFHFEVTHREYRRDGECIRERSDAPEYRGRSNDRSERRSSCPRWKRPQTKSSRDGPRRFRACPE